MDRRRTAGVLLALAACVVYATAAPTASNHTSLDLYDVPGASDGCYYNFQHYGESDRIMTNEPCLNCTCHNRMLMCYLRVCPFTKPIGQDCTIEKRADQCCPIVTCPDVPVDLLTSTTTSPSEYGSTGLGKLDKYGCSIHGKYFPEGSKVPPTPNKPCEHCYCIRNMTTCVMQECTLHVDGCTPIYHKDVCCPVRYSCDHPEDEMPLLDDLSTTVRPTPGFLLTTTTLSPVTQMSQNCLYENQIIPDGALIKTEKACDHCYCMKGDIVCVVQECGTPMENEGKNCSAIAPREGVCCPDTYICEGDEPTTGTYEGLDYTTELEQDIHTTLLPPRRAGSEGSGYRNEPDDIPKTELPFETDTEGSGDEQTTIRPTVITETLPSSTEEPYEFITFTTSKAPVSEYEDIESEKHKDTSETQQYIPSTTSTYILQQSDELSTTKAQDEDVGSGEEGIITPHEIVPTPTIDESEPAVTIEQNIATESNKEDNYESHVEESITSTPTVVEDQTNLPKEQSVASYSNTVDITTETHHRDKDENVKSTTTIEESEQSSVQTTTSVSIMDKEEKITMPSVEKDKIDVHYATETFEPQHYSTFSTSSPSFEDEIATTDSQNVVTDSFEGAEADFDPHHQITMTASTPLLEEIEKDTTDQENLPVETTFDKHKTTTTSTNVFIEKTTDKDSLKPDLLDETIATNILTTISPFDNDDVTTAEPQASQEAEVEESSPQHYVPITSAPTFDDESKKTTPFDSLNISDPQKGQELEESSEPQQYSSTTSAAVLEDENKKTTFSDFINTSEPHKAQESDVEDSSELQQYAPTTTASDVDDETKQSDSLTTLEPQETDFEGSSEPQQLAPTTRTPNSDEEIKQTITSSSSTTSEPKKSQETNVEESSEPQQYIPTTSASVFIDESKKTTLLESITTLEPQKAQETDTKESSEPQQYATTTSASAFDKEAQKTTALESITTQEPQKGHEADFEESSESQLYSPTTNAPSFGDKSKKTTPLDSISTSESQKAQETDVEETSKLHHYAPTTNIPALEDESPKTTPSESISTSESENGSEKDVKESLDPQLYYPTTNVPALEDESKKTTQSDIQYITDAVFEDSSATTFEQNEITTAEPDKGLNTIPSGSVEEEATESPEIEKYTQVGNIITEKANELDNKFDDEIEKITDQYKFTTLLPDPSASQEDQFSLTTESIVNQNINSIGSTATRDIAEQTTVLFDVSEEGVTHPSSTKSHVSVYQETDTTSVPLNTENIKQTADSMEPIATVTYESSTQSTGTDDSTSEKHEIVTPSYVTMPETSTANLEENEIINEPRIPGEGDCLLNGVTYRNESTVPSTNKCQSGCRCSSSIIKCDPILCSPPPEYMNNCQTTYDSPDSCCPTYVCDHKTETMPPQSHSQMSGTEAPVMSPVECNGDECVLSQDKDQSVEKPALCDSGSCITQDETSSHQSNLPVQPAVDQKEGCAGDKCTSSESSDQLCSQENGCQASPVKPCEGTECEIGLDTILPQKQPCTDGGNCDVPVKDCSAGKCSPDALNVEKKPSKKICVNKEDCVDQLDIETECSEKSCKRKDDFPSEKQPPKKCSGTECQSTDFISGVELTTASSLATTQKDVERKEQNQSTDNLESESEKPEISSKLPSIDSDRTTRPIEDITEEPSQNESIHPGKVSERTTTITDITTKLPDFDDMVKTNTVSESATLSEGQFITDSPAPYLKESTKVYENEIDTEEPIYSPDIYKTEKQYDMTTETGDNVHTDSSTMATKESETDSTKIYVTEPQVTKSPEKEVSEEAASPIPEVIFTDLPKTEHTEFYEAFKPTEREESTKKTADTLTTVPSYDTETQEVNKSPIDGQNDEITTKPPGFDSEPQEVTKSPQESEDEGTTIKITEEIGSTPSKTYDSDLHEATESPEVSVSVEVTTQIADGAETSKYYNNDRQGITKAPEEYQSVEKTTPKSTDEITTSSEVSIAVETTKTEEDERDDLTTHSLEKLTTDSSKPYDAEEKEVTKLSDSSLNEKTTPSMDDMLTETSRRPNIEATSQSSFNPENEETATKIAEQVVTETLKPHDTEIQEITTPSSEGTENEESSKKSTVTEPSISVDIEEQKASKSTDTIEVTTKEEIDETGTESPKHDDLSHDTTVPQQETEKELTINEETGTESPQPIEYEPPSTAKSPDAFDNEEAMANVTREDLKPQEVTQSSESESMPSPYTTTSISTDVKHKDPSESHPLEIITTSQADTIFELTTPSILPSTEPERTMNEITTELQEQSQTTGSPKQSATESLDDETTTSSVSPIHKDEDVMLTETPLNLVTKPYSEVATSHKITEDDTTATQIDLSSVTDLPKEQDTKMPDEHKKATEEIVELEEITKKPTSTSSFDDQLHEDAKTELPVLHETEEDSISEVTTSKPIYGTYDIDMKTELPETPPKEEPSKTADISTEKPYNAEKATTEAIIEDSKTKMPVDSEIKQDDQTDKPIIREQEPVPTLSSEIETSGKDILEIETPSVTELITSMPVDEEKLTEKPIEIIKQTEITQNPDFSTKSTQPEEEIYTKTPSQDTSEAAATETPYIPGQGVNEELTTPAIQIYDSTAEPSKIPTKSSISSDVYTEKPAVTTHKQSSEPAVTEQSEEESSTSRIGAGHQDIETIQEISTPPESSTKYQPLTEIYQLSTELPKETYTAASEEKITTEGPVMVETEKLYESVTESEEKITEDTKIKKPQQDNLEPTTTESVEQITKIQGQGESENVEVATGHTTSDETLTNPSGLNISEATEAIETSTKLSDIITSQPVEDIEKSSNDEHPSISKEELTETTTIHIDDENIPSIVKESTEIPITTTDQQVVEIVTEHQPALIDTATTKQETTPESMEDEFITSKTSRPDMYPTTLSAAEDAEKSTSSPVIVEESTAPDQTMLSSIEPHVSEGEPPAFTVVSEMDKASTLIPEFVEHTEKITTPTKIPDTETLAPEEEKLTTPKAEEIPSVSSVYDKFIEPTHKPTEATEQPRPVTTEEQPTEDLLTPDEEPSIPPSGTSGYGTDPDYMEEDQTFGPGTCRYGGKVYVSAQQIPRDDPCDFCFCFRSDIICLQQSCPPPIHGCHEEPISGFCCPRYECPVSMATTVNVTTTTTTTTTTLPPHFPVHSYKGSAQKRGCLIKGHTYKVGEVVRASSGPCLHCTCGGDGQMKCDPKQCTPEPMLRQMIAAAVSAKRRR